MTPEYSVYILKCSDNSFYIGSTNDIRRRLNQHNNIKGGAKYTRARRPVQLVYLEKCGNISDARKREYQLKKLTRQEKEILVNSQH